MHGSVMRFVGAIVRQADLRGKRVLEIGSMDVNGSVRPLFETDDYLGIDMRPGSGVDLVIDAHDLNTAYMDPFDAVVCCEMLEHDDQPWLTLQNALAKTKDGGMLILTARGFDERGAFPLHGHPSDYWRFSKVGLTRLLQYCGWERVRTYTDLEAPGVFAVAIKRNG